MAIDRDKILESAQKLVAKGRFDKAILEFQKLIADDPNDARTLLRVGDLHLKAQQYAEAIAVYERVGQQSNLLVSEVRPARRAALNRGGWWRLTNAGWCARPEVLHGPVTAIP